MSGDGASLLRRLDEALAPDGLMTRGAIVEHAWASGGAGPTEEGDAASRSSSTPADYGAAPTPLCPAGHLPRKGGDRQEIGTSDVNGAEVGAGKEGGRTVVLVGHAGSSIWPHFEAWRAVAPEGGMPHPLDLWSRQVLETIAEEFGARAVFPSDRPYLPFQTWAMRADGLRPSPLGLLIDPVHGLWHAYRGALVFDQVLDLAPPEPKPHPCDTCETKPCLSACPVEAFDAGRFDAAACRAYLATAAGNGCLTSGCLARHACPIGRSYVYATDQQRFHMAAFAGA